MADFDVIIIGAGPGGYVCAIRCAQLGLKTAVVEGRDTLGGTCLNVGCIPSKALLHASHLLHEAEHNFEKVGLIGEAPKVDWAKMQGYKNSVIGGNTKGIEFLFKKNKITWIKGWASIPEAGKVVVGDESYSASHIIIATGSEPAELGGVEVDEETIVTSTGALQLANIPRSLIVIGAGVIGLELGSVYRRLGAEVTVLEYQDSILPGQDSEVQKAFHKMLQKQGFKIVTGAKVKSARKGASGALVEYESIKDGSVAAIEADAVLLATGRKPFLSGLGIEGLGVSTNQLGQLVVDETFQTTVPGVYAIGDAIAGAMLAHKAEDEGVALAEILAGRKGHVNYQVIPGVIYTHPEVASVGVSEDRLRESDRKYKVGKFPFMGNGRAKAVMCADGFVKMLIDAETDQILGCHIIGPCAGDLIHEVCVAMETGSKASDLAKNLPRHPTFSEAVREAAMASSGGAIHA